MDCCCPLIVDASISTIKPSTPEVAMLFTTVAICFLYSILSLLISLLFHLKLSAHSFLSNSYPCPVFCVQTSIAYTYHGSHMSSSFISFCMRSSCSAWDIFPSTNILYCSCGLFLKPDKTLEVSMTCENKVSLSSDRKFA